MNLANKKILSSRPGKQFVLSFLIGTVLLGSSMTANASTSIFVKNGICGPIHVVLTPSDPKKCRGVGTTIQGGKHSSIDVDKGCAYLVGATLDTGSSSFQKYAKCENVKIGTIIEFKFSNGFQCINPITAKEWSEPGNCNGSK